ncbi:nucleoside diphosphate kinase-like, partial [Anoplophora glabripennis]|uniref:nucleoside diphosphate kinase-like n=1 Tax=Anoplophora glabripennis TaxID=217634 RepID=UPI000874C02A
ILMQFKQKRFKVAALKFMWSSDELRKQHYADLSAKAFFPKLIKYISSGPVVPIVWEGLDVVKNLVVYFLVLQIQADSAPGTIRGDLCVEVGRNICQGSDGVKSAKKEISLWYKTTFI